MIPLISDPYIIEKIKTVGPNKSPNIFIPTILYPTAEISTFGIQGAK